MSGIGIAITAVLGALSVFLVVIILMQSDRAAGLGALGGGSSASRDTYWSKNKGNSMEGALERYTKIGGALFLILCFASNFVH